MGADGSGLDTGDGFVNAAIGNLDFYPQAIGSAQILNEYQAFRSSAGTRDGSTLAGGFVSDTLRAPAVQVGTAVSQSVAGLWNGASVTSYRKVDGDDWLTVGADGVVSGTAPASAPDLPASITVEASDGTTTSQIFVEIPVLAAAADVPFTASTWNLWDAGSHVTDATRKNAAVLAANGLDVVGVQEDGGVGARRLAGVLGWNAVEASSGGLGLVTPYPLSDVREVSVGGAVTAFSAEVRVLGRASRVWVIGLDQTAPGPETACAAHPSPAQLEASERQMARYGEAKQVTAAAVDDIASAAQTPVIVLGDFASPSGADWTAATASAHCGIGAVDWPVTAMFRSVGLSDSFRVAHPDPSRDPGNTFSPIVTTSRAGMLEPQDRLDAVLYAGPSLAVRGSNTLVAGSPSATNVLDNSWTSDHRAVVTSLTFLAPSSGGGTSGGGNGGASGGESGSGASGGAPAGGQGSSAQQGSTGAQGSRTGGEAGSAPASASAPSVTPTDTPQPSATSSPQAGALTASVAPSTSAPVASGTTDPGAGGLVIGILVGGMVVLAALVLGGVLLVRRRGA